MRYQVLANNKPVLKADKEPLIYADKSAAELRIAFWKKTNPKKRFELKEIQ